MALVVVAPQGADLVLASDVPDLVTFAGICGVTCFDLVPFVCLVPFISVALNSLFFFF